MRLIGVLVLLGVTACSDPPPERPPPSRGVPESDEAERDGQGLGTVDFPVSCDGPAARRMTRGVALLHHMMYTEADAAFAAAAEADPACAMAAWGRAMALIHPMWPDVPTGDELERGATLATRAAATGPKTDREAAYIAAVEAYFREAGQRTEAERLASFHDGWRAVHEAYPEDHEADAFEALTLLSMVEIGRADSSETAMAAVRRMRGLLDAVQDHPGAQHYTIHAFDYAPPDPWAVEIARRYGRLAPEVPHALHMPTHVFTTLGLWRESIELNERSAAAAFEQGRGGTGLDNHYPHALGYLVYADLQTGHDTKAQEVVDRVVSVQGPFSELNRLVVAAHFAGIPVRFALERHAWGEAARLEPRATASFPWDEYPQFDALAYYGRTLGAARSGDAEAARAALGELQGALERAGPRGTARWLTRDRDVLEMAASAWVDFAEGDTERAVRTMEEVARRSVGSTVLGPGELLPAAEQLADMYFELDRYSEARAAYEAVLDRLPKRLNSICGLARTAERMGDRSIADPYRADLDAVLRSEAAGRCL